MPSPYRYRYSTKSFGISNTFVLNSSWDRRQNLFCILQKEEMQYEENQWQSKNYAKVR